MSKRYGPIVCARFISGNLLRVLASCYGDLDVATCHQNSKVGYFHFANVFAIFSVVPSFNKVNSFQDVFSLVLDGESVGIRVESCLSDIVAAYGSTFVTVRIFICVRSHFPRFTS